jgi:hypothetical protein
MPPKGQKINTHAYAIKAKGISLKKAGVPESTEYL